MQGASQSLLGRLRRAACGDDGSATVEFVILFPMIMWIFLSSFEVSIFLTRSVLLDRSLDLNVRLLRLNMVENMTREELEKRVCADALIFENCPDAVMIELTKVSTTTFNMPSPNATCRRRDEEIDPPAFATELPNDLMIVRACAVLDPFFGTTPLVMQMPSQPGGGYAVIAASSFVNEP